MTEKIPGEGESGRYKETVRLDAASGAVQTGKERIVEE